MSHTKGPWKERQEYANRWAIESHEQGELPVGLAHVSTTVCGVGVSDDETAANARLIAAAPELLEACEALLPYAESRAEDLDEAGAGADARAAVERARAAIAKAREGSNG